MLQNIDYWNTTALTILEELFIWSIHHHYPRDIKSIFDHLEESIRAEANGYRRCDRLNFYRKSVVSGTDDESPASTKDASLSTPEFIKNQNKIIKMGYDFSVGSVHTSDKNQFNTGPQMTKFSTIFDEK